MGIRTDIVDRPLLPVIPRLSPAYELTTCDPVEAAEEVAAYHGRSTAAYIDFAEAFKTCWERFSANEKRVAFLKRLADLGVISQRDAMVLARPNGMVSMIKKIGENAHWLRRSEILPFLVPEPSKLYQIVLLRELLNDDFDLTVSKLRTLEPGYTRDEIIDLRPLAGAFDPTEHKTHSGDSGKDQPGKTVQVKANFSASQIGFRGEADLLLCLKIDLNGDWTEIYYGDFQPVKQASRHSARDNNSMIAISALIRIKESGYKLPEKMPITTPDATADDEPI